LTREGIDYIATRLKALDKEKTDRDRQLWQFWVSNTIAMCSLIVAGLAILFG
jgi:hypothetical protein